MHAPVIGIGNVQIGAVPGQRRRRSQPVGRSRCLVAGPSTCPRMKSGAAPDGGGYVAVNQDAIVAAIGDEQPGAVGERVAREAQRAAAQRRVRGIVGKIRAVRNRAHHGSFLVGGVGARRRGTPVNELLGIELVRSGWPRATSAACAFFVGRLFQMSTRLWPRSGHVEPHAVGCHRNRVEQVVGRRVGLGLRQIGLDKSREVGLPQHDVRRHAVATWGWN